MQMNQKAVAVLLVAGMLVSMASPVAIAAGEQTPPATTVNQQEDTKQDNTKTDETVTGDVLEGQQSNTDQNTQEEKEPPVSQTPTEGQENTTGQNAGENQKPVTGQETEEIQKPATGQDVQENQEPTAGQETQQGQSGEQQTVQTVEQKGLKAASTVETAAAADTKIPSSAFSHPQLYNAVRTAAGVAAGAPLTVADAEKITKFSYSNTDFMIWDLTGIGCLTNLKELDLSGNIIENTGFLNALTKLEKLNLSNQHSKLKDLSPLAAASLPNLTTLDVSNNSTLTNLGTINLTSVTKLNASSCAIENVATIQQGLANSLVELDLSGNKISSLRMPAMPKLTTLHLNTLPVNDPSPLSIHTALTTLNVNNCQIRDLSAVEGLARLTTLSAKNNPIADVSVVNGPASLTKLDLSNCEIVMVSKSVDSKGLCTLSALTDLNLSGNKITTIGTGSLPTTLTKLDLSNNALNTPTGLSSLSALKPSGLNLDGHLIAEKSALESNLHNNFKNDSGYTAWINKYFPSTPPNTVNKTGLQAAIRNAGITKEDIDLEISKDGTNVLPSKKWVTQNDVDSLNEAIEAANKVLKKVNVTQAELDGAANDLNTAIGKFDTAKKAGTKAPEVKKAILLAAINEAGEEVEKYVVAAKASDVAKGVKYVTQGAKDTFSTAISTAEKVYNDASADQDKVNDAVTALATATTTFLGATGTGTKENVGDPGELKAEIITATGNLKNTPFSTNGSDVAANLYWVTKDEHDAYSAAITAAENYAKTEHKQADLDSALATLREKSKIFEEAKKKGTAVKTYTISFDSKGGSEVEPIAGVPVNTTATAPTAPTRSGYLFDGWYIDDACTKPWDFAANKVTADTLLIAKWAKVYKVTFNTDGGTAINSMDVADGKTITPPANPTYTGKSFAGWYADSTFQKPWNFETDTVTKDTTLYAKWDYTAQGYNVKLTVTGGEYGKVTLEDGSDPSRRQFKKGETVTLKAVPTSDGKFVSWSSSDVSTDTSATLTFTMPENDIAISCTFNKIPSYNVTVSTGGNGTAKADVQAAKAGTVVNITATPYSGYEFDYWEVSPTTVVLANAKSATTSFTMPAGNVIVKAHFKAKSSSGNNNGSSTGTNNSNTSGKDSDKSSSSSSNSNNSSSGNKSTTVTEKKAATATTTAVKKAVKSAKDAGKDSGKAAVRFKNIKTISPSVLKSIQSAAKKADGGLDIEVVVYADTIANGKVQARMYLDPAAASKLTKTINTSIDVKENSKDNQAAVKAVQKKYGKDAVAVTLAQKGTMEIPVKVAVKVDLSSLNKKALYFYQYQSNGTFKKIKAPAYTIDKNGYLHFITPVGGSIVITDEPLTK